MSFGILILCHLVGDYVLQNDWMAARKRHSSFACSVHVAVYTLSFLVIITLSGYTWPWWAYLVIAATHWPVDRFGLAKTWMIHVSRQRNFAEALAPWSVIVVDNTYHLLCAWAVWAMIYTT